MNNQEYQDHLKSQRLNRYGFDADPNRVRIHRDERPKHVAARFLCGYVLQNANPKRGWDTECVISESGDRVDILDFNELGAEPRCVEFESNPTQPVIESKLDRYVHNGPLSECYVLDLREAPTDVNQLVDWIENQLAGV